jgi:hypothetical protein
VNLHFSALEHVENSTDTELNETRPLSDSPSSAEIAPTPSRRLVKYTNRRLLDGGKLLTFPRFPLNGSVVYLNRGQHEAR